MPRYFLELAYKGTAYSGFQVQQNANSVQSEVEKAFSIFFRQPVALTGASRTDAGVHALQNYFHFDFNRDIQSENIYRLNAILPADISLLKLRAVHQEAHCRFDAISREYRYYVYFRKDPFLNDRAYFYPYRIDWNLVQEAAVMIRRFTDFSSFSKRNTQVKHFLCTIFESEWEVQGSCRVYHIRATRFLRGMVRGLTATMLKIGRGALSLTDLEVILAAKDNAGASFDVPARGLFLERVEYPETVWLPG